MTAVHGFFCRMLEEWVVKTALDINNSEIQQVLIHIHRLKFYHLTLFPLS